MIIQCVLPRSEMAFTFELKVGPEKKVWVPFLQGKKVFFASS